MPSSDERAKQAGRVTLIGLVWNVFLTAIKLWIGIWGNSTALMADAVHSLSDFATDIAVLAGLKIAQKPVDATHHYGHGKFETLSAIFISISLFTVGLGLLWTGCKTIYLILHGYTVSTPEIWTMVAAFISILVKEGLYNYTIKAGRKYESQALIANAWHHRSDALSSIGVFIGISGAIFLGKNWIVLDPIAAILVSFFILKASYSTARISLSELTEASLTQEVNQMILNTVKSVKGVFYPHNLKTRKIGNTIAIDLHIKVKPSLSIVEAHDIATETENKLKEIYGKQTFISIHVEPLGSKK
ncbi:MAG: cation transporter [Calditrichaceae bacterium]|nr:cation transporter [Calditrichaceae bacterium]MBN2710468.1 cation transporter [Calditrichaceae bacterium]RQV93598.1 MAG: cation transporter [Calditrichota bacterium]